MYPNVRECIVLQSLNVFIFLPLEYGFRAHFWSPDDGGLASNCRRQHSPPLGREQVNVHGGSGVNACVKPPPIVYPLRHCTSETAGKRLSEAVRFQRTDQSLHARRSA